MNYKIKKIGIGKPTIGIVGCVHGDELMGEKIINKLKKLNIQKGSLALIIANTEALKNKKRCIDSDLNRVFPGKKNGNHEEKLAFSLMEELKKCDYVFDIHSTTTDVHSLIITTKINKKNLGLINIIKPKRVAIIKKDMGKGDLIHNCKAGITFEYGRDNDSKTLDKTYKDILVILKNLGMINNKVRANKHKTEFYKIIGEVKKDINDKLINGIKNFKLLKEGQIIAKNGSKIVRAHKNYYPILFGKKSYNDIFGYEAKIIKNIK